MNRFEWKNGKLLHYIADELRAEVARENVLDYCQAVGVDPETLPAEG